jgi:molybdate transport system substrate-binding protein
MRKVLVTLALLAALAPCARAQDTILVFAAASLKDALDAANAAWVQQGRPKVTPSYAASSALAKQIENGAPAQVFISADLDWMDYVEKKGLTQPATRRNLLGNRLVLVAPAGSKVQAVITPGFPLAQLLGPSGRLALGDPQHVPIGKYAKAALEKLGVWDSVSGRIAAAESVRASLAFVARDEAPLGIVYETDARSEPKVRIVATFGEGLHPPVIYPAALLKDAKGAAVDYLKFLSAPQARALFQKYGFTPLN